MAFEDAAVPPTSLEYWLHWEVAVCFLCVVASLGASIYLLWRYEGPHAEAGPAAGTERPARSAGVTYDEEAWRCVRDLHPAWLLGYRLVAFVFFFTHNTVIVSGDLEMLFYYTEWTFTLVTVYFGLGTVLSIHGWIKVARAVSKDIERGPDEPPEVAGFWTYLLQILYQMSAGAVMLTDTVFWFIIFPYLLTLHKPLSYDKVVMHSVNFVFLLGESTLHTLHFPWFRIAYFVLFTSIYVIFQWSVHALHDIRWPYQFLSLSSKMAPLWYISAGLLQLPCFAVFRLLFQLKNRLMTPPSPSTKPFSDNKTSEISGWSEE